MKGLFTGLIIGGLLTWGYFSTIGEKHITETVKITIVETNWVTQYDIRTMTETKWITKTNEVWKTNVVEKIVQTVTVAPVVQKVTEQPKVVQPVIVQPTTTAPITEIPTGLRKARPAGKVTSGISTKRDMSVKTRKDMDGNIK